MSLPIRSNGFTRKPVWIYFAAGALIISPLGNFLTTLLTMGIPGWYSPKVWMLWLPYVEWKVWGLMACLFASGISLLFVRKWSLLAAALSVLMVLIYTLATARQLMFLGTWFIASSVVISAATILLIFFSPFRLPYLNPKLRWWEGDPRYKADFPVKFEGAERNGLLQDISLSGALVEWTDARAHPTLEMGAESELVLPNGLRIRFQVARVTANGYGVRFVATNRAQRKSLRAWLSDLRPKPGRPNASSG